MKVNECMCTDVHSVKADTKLNEVAKLMSKKHIGAIPVCDNNNCICGIVTDRDIILRSIACEKDPKSTKVSDIMTTEVCTCKKDDEMTNAQSKMGENQIRRLPVCDNNNHIIGILTLADLTNNGAQLGKQEVTTTIENICNCNRQEKNAE